jgi:phosphatidate cytidylyltransferase
MTATRRWHDLMPRILSGIALAIAGAVVVWLGGPVYVLTACAAGGVMIWESARMFGAPAPRADGALAAAALGLAALLPGMFVLPLLGAAALVGAARAVPGQRGLCLGVHLWVLLAVFALVVLRDAGGAVGLAWLVCVVVASDVAGYFAGRLLGGPKFWPAVSPKKTWSGTLAGWAAAALVGAAFSAAVGGAWLVAASVLVALAGQLGDIGESAVKRQAGVKDSSALIPGHGGVFDRFDALLGAAALASVLRLFGWGV